jgi:hypothetical protein
MVRKKLKAKRVKGRGLRVKGPGSRIKKAKPKKAIKRKLKPRSRVKAKKSQGPEASLEKIGKVTHYFPQVNAAAVKLLKDGLKIGDSIYIKGHTTDFKEVVTSMQLDRVPIEVGRKSQEIGVAVKSRVRRGDGVYRV